MSSQDRADAARMELAIAGVLRLGVMTSSVCLALGLVGGLFRPESAVPPFLLSAGLLLLLGTPVARVVVSVVDYARERDWRFVLLTTIVLLELAGSIVAAIWGRR